jgi:hypothetical protein
MGKNDRPLMERMMAKVRLDSDGCWTWTGSRIHNGYGKVKVNGLQVVSHRASYEALVGPIPDGMQLDHLCRNRACINPDHLEPVSKRENLLRGIGPTAVNAAKSACVRGHLLSGDNVRIVVGASGHDTRRCRQCERDRKNEHRQRAKVRP